jgi:ketosteroid isomerase-like protein
MVSGMLRPRGEGEDMPTSQVPGLFTWLLAGALTCAQYGCATPSVTADDARDQLLALNATYDAALEAGDAAALDRLYADDFQYFGPGAIVRTKQQQIEAFASGAIDLLEGKSHDVAIRQYGNAAVLTGGFKGRARIGGQEYGFSERYSSVWVRGREGWRLVLEHGTVVPNVPAPVGDQD